MERDGLVLRHVVSEKPLRPDYELTEYGSGLTPVTEAICQWGSAHLKRLERQKAEPAGAAVDSDAPARKV